MQKFTALFDALDSTTRTTEKEAALERYFSEAAPEDAAWALAFLTGKRIKRNVNGAQLRAWCAEETGLPLWIVEESYDAVGDLAETVALLLPQSEEPATFALHTMVEERLLPLSKLAEAEKAALLKETWRLLDTRQRLVWNKIITGSFRVGASKTLVVRALAKVTGVPAAVMAHRLSGTWKPTGTFFKELTATEFLHSEPMQPYPFYLSYAIEGDVAALGSFEDWQVEWKWDGIRSQLLCRGGETNLWSRGEDLITDRFPEIIESAGGLPSGTVLDGELLAWKNDMVLPFGELQRRIGRKNVDAKTKAEVPVRFLAYDVLEWEGQDVRTWPLARRRALLEDILGAHSKHGCIGLSPLVAASSWNDVKTLFAESRSRRVEGFMLKSRASVYGVGRQKSHWWKWKTDPYTIDAVLVYAQRGHGRRASLLTDYTFALWDDGKLVPMAKAYSGLTDPEILELDAKLRQTTTERFGPMRAVTPTQVFELGFEGIQKSKRHKSGVAVRFPRILRWRKDKQPADADTLETLRGLADENAP